MLNYIWAGLIIASLAFAVFIDVREMRADPYRNGRPLAVTIRFPAGADPKRERSDVEVVIDPATYQSHFNVTSAPSAPLKATLLRTSAGDQLRFAKDAALPAPLSSMVNLQNKDKELRARVRDLRREGQTAPASIAFDPVRFAKIKAVQEAGIESAKDAVQLAIGLIGTLALWLGLMKIAEASGLVNVLVRVVQPLLRPLFPSVPPGHPALGAIALNVAANMLGLGNAATPFGIKAMEELQKLNPSDDTATDGMVMLLAINTAGVQLVPAGTLVALMGVAAGEVFLPMLVVTGIALVIAIVSAKVLGRLPAYRRTNPDRLARATSSPLLTSETEAAS
jgi:spore maturation protein A